MVAVSLTTTGCQAKRLMPEHQRELRKVRDDKDFLCGLPEGLGLEFKANEARKAVNADALWDICLSIYLDLEWQQLRPP